MKENETKTQAELNQDKIYRFIISLVWQFVVLFVVVYATVAQNMYAGWALLGYVSFVGLALFGYSIGLFRGPQVLAQKDLSSLRYMVSPTAQVTLVIGSIFTVVEAVIMLSTGFFFYAAIWIAADIIQHLYVRLTRKAIALQDAGDVELGPRENRSADDMIRDIKDPEVLEELRDTLETLREECEDIDYKMRCLAKDGTLPPEGSLNRKDYDKLAEERDLKVQELEAALTKAAYKGQLRHL